jgi:hypothetical protein
MRYYRARAADIPLQIQNDPRRPSRPCGNRMREQDSIALHEMAIDPATVVTTTVTARL